jgi:hypothetical protein
MSLRCDLGVRDRVCAHAASALLIAWREIVFFSPFHFSPRKGRIMNALAINYQGQEIDYQADFRRAPEGEPRLRRSRKFSSSRRSRGPLAFNGIHRRRNKRWTW